MKVVFAVVVLVVMATGCSRFENPAAPEAGEGSLSKMTDTYNAVDDIMLIDDYGRQVVYEDAEDGLTNNWWKDPDNTAAEIQNIYDAQRGSRVIELFDMGTNTRFILADGEGDGSYWNYSWNNTTHFNISFSLKYNVNFVAYVIVSTSGGNRWIEYHPSDIQSGLHPLYNNTVQIGLGSELLDGQWHTVTRDLREDLKAGLDEEIYEVRLFKIRGYSENTPPPPPSINDAHTIGFWKNNIKKVVLQHKKRGTQVSREDLDSYLAFIREFNGKPFDYMTFRRAYNIMNYHGKDALSLLKKQLMASEFNLAAGAYINGDQALTEDFIRAGEAMVNNPGTRQEILTLQKKFDAYNNGANDMWN